MAFVVVFTLLPTRYNSAKSHCFGICYPVAYTAYIHIHTYLRLLIALTHYACRRSPLCCLQRHQQLLSSLHSFSIFVYCVYRLPRSPTQPPSFAYVIKFFHCVLFISYIHLLLRSCVCLF